MTVTMIQTTNTMAIMAKRTIVVASVFRHALPCGTAPQEPTIGTELMLMRMTTTLAITIAAMIIVVFGPQEDASKFLCKRR